MFSAKTITGLRDKLYLILEAWYQPNQVISIHHSYSILNIVIIEKNNREEIVEELRSLVLSEARIFLLYSSRREAQEILAAAAQLEMTNKNYMWIVTQSVLGRGNGNAPGEFPPGMLGIICCYVFYYFHFN